MRMGPCQFLYLDISGRPNQLTIVGVTFLPVPYVDLEITVSGMVDSEDWVQVEGCSNVPEMWTFFNAQIVPEGPSD